ncbi:LETM1-related biofilm-associated protein [Winogradskyella bathintestinalis]|uniref:LETM1-related biofilm-associated protein n=1 Tax=Winogradskyella bathintestinalis TaxID=3035208 RepID=A0ABT7ZVE5_9FLAO|nr:LETM1-related biofilm-associated protein [Winogradskyella bathintestinalis]MDN3493009.1 LETM1-related biofilm-associated protein [Winogradskyella bathintestinalis]
MNPSAHGWIKKLLTQVSETKYSETENAEFYNRLKHAGFIYGSNIKVVLDIVKPFDFTEEERCKINLLLTYYFIFIKENTKEDFLDSLIRYYKSIDDKKRSFFEELFGNKKPDNLLEQVIHKRIHIDDNFISKSFNYFLINALLFVDVLGYHRFLKDENNIKTYVNRLESALETIVFSVIDQKSEKTEYDENLIKLFEDSIRHKNSKLPSYDEAVAFISAPLEKLYVIDLVCMASWTDKLIDTEEREFLVRLKNDLSLNSEIVAQSVNDINLFYDEHKEQVAFLSSKNLAQSFYNNSSKVVSKLITRNSKRLITELSESKEAMTLLAQSTTRQLTDEEQKKIQSQLMDIFKSIPSLAIFLLPGGMLLLPLFVKFIPKLLPSAFDENRIDIKKKS